MSFQKIQVRRTLSQGLRAHRTCQWALSRVKVPVCSVEENSTLLLGCCSGSGFWLWGALSPVYLFISNSPVMPIAEVPLDSKKSALRPSTTDSALPFNPPATQSVLQICYRNHFIQHRYAEVSGVESGSCSIHSLTETLLTISIYFAIVTVMLVVKMSEIFVCFSKTIL